MILQCLHTRKDIVIAMYKQKVLVFDFDAIFLPFCLNYLFITFSKYHEFFLTPPEINQSVFVAGVDING